MFPALAALAGFQRVLAEAHFLSDTFWGAALGCIFAPLCIYGSRLARAFDRLDERLTAGASAIAQPGAPHKRPAATSPAASLSGDATRAA